MKKFEILPIVLMLGVMLGGAYVYLGTNLLSPPQEKREILMPIEGLENHQLNYNGEPWNFSQGVMPYNIIYVGFVNCPDVCPLTLNQTASALAKLPKFKRDKLRVIFVSVDHEADTPESVAKYAKNFNENFIGLTGTKDQISKFVEAIGGQYFKRDTPNSALKYNYAHSDRLFIIDRNGDLIATINQAHSVDIILSNFKNIF